MLAAVLALASAQGFTIPPATQFMSDKEIDEFVVEVRTAHYSADHFDPLWLIQTVNKLQPMGKEKGLALVREIGNRRVSVGDKIGRDLYWLVNLLFEAPYNGQLSPPRLGTITPGPPRNFKTTPRWPIFLESDIPFEPGFKLTPSEPTETFEGYAVRLAATETWRKSLLVPSHDPFNAFDRLARRAGYAELYGHNSFDQLELANQIARLVRNIYKPDRRGLSGTQAMSMYRNQLTQLRPEWSKTAQNYYKR